MKKIKFKILNKIIKILKYNNYQNIQYMPTNFSILGLFKEPENLINLFYKKKHLLFYYSIFPKFYFFFLDKKVKLLFKIFFLNSTITRDQLLNFIDEEYINISISLGLIQKIKNYYRFNISLVPYDNHIFIRDANSVYKRYFDPKKSKNNVWMGADSVIFIKFLKNYIKKKKIKNVLELGSGTGIVISSISKYFINCEAIDINHRSVEMTKLNAKLNKINNLKVYKSNLFQNVKKKFYLIIANPWFVDLKKNGLEEAPKIINNLKKNLKKNGKCLLLMNSYLKNNLDTLEIYFRKLLKKKKYDINLYTNGFFYEFIRNKEYKKENIQYAISYNVEIKISGEGKLIKYKPNNLRRFRDFIFINLIKALRKCSIL